MYFFYQKPFISIKKRFKYTIKIHKEWQKQLLMLIRRRCHYILRFVSQFFQVFQQLFFFIHLYEEFIVKYSIKLSLYIIFSRPLLKGWLWKTLKKCLQCCHIEQKGIKTDRT